MTVTLIKGLVGTRPGQQGSNPSPISNSTAQAQSQVAAANAAAANSARGVSDAAVLRLSNHSSIPADKIRNADKAQEKAEKLADDVREGKDRDGVEAHAGLGPTTARDHVVA